MAGERSFGGEVSNAAIREGPSDQPQTQQSIWEDKPLGDLQTGESTPPSDDSLEDSGTSSGGKGDAAPDKLDPTSTTDPDVQLAKSWGLAPDAIAKFPDRETLRSALSALPGQIQAMAAAQAQQRQQMAGQQQQRLDPNDLVGLAASIPPESLMANLQSHKSWGDMGEEAQAVLGAINSHYGGLIGNILRSFAGEVQAMRQAIMGMVAQQDDSMVKSALQGITDEDVKSVTGAYLASDANAARLRQEIIATIRSMPGNITPEQRLLTALMWRHKADIDKSASARKSKSAKASADRLARHAVGVGSTRRMNGRSSRSNVIDEVREILRRDG